MLAWLLCVSVCAFIYISIERATNLVFNFEKRVFCDTNDEFHIVQREILSLFT